MFPLFQKYLNSYVRNNKLVNNVVYHSCLSMLASGKHPYFFKLPRVLSLSRMLVEFSDLYIPPCVEKLFQFMVFTLENALNLGIFTHSPVTHSKLQEQFFENMFSQWPRTKGWGKLWFALLKFNLKMWRWLGTLLYLYFVWFIVFLNMMV